MQVGNLPPLQDAPLRRLQRAYRRSDTRKALLWVKRKTLRPIHFLLLSVLLVTGLLGLHFYMHSHLYVVRIDGHEAGLVRDCAEVDVFLEDLMAKCGALYAMEVTPRQDITLTWEFRPYGEPDSRQAAEALRRRISLVTEAVMVTVDGLPVVPVSTEQDVETVVQLVRLAYVSQDQNVTLLEVELLEEVAGESCVVPPEQVFPAEKVAALLTGEERYPVDLLASRDFPVSRSGRFDEADSAVVEPVEIPVVHVQVVEMAAAEERIPFTTIYRNNSNMWSGQSRVVTAGAEGRKEVTYRITRVNGEETARETVSERVMQEPVHRVVERGTAARLAWPVAGWGRISQYFRGSAHRGIDIAAPMGTSILAAESGVVVRSAWGSSQGNYIIIYHGTYWTLYLHNSVNLVSAGQRVSRGQVIARLGSTGNSTGPHLHFEVRRCTGSGIWTGWYHHPAIDPLTLLR